MIEKWINKYILYGQIQQVWKLLLELRVEKTFIYTKGSGLKISHLLLLSQSYQNQSYQFFIFQMSCRNSSKTALPLLLFYQFSDVSFGDWAKKTLECQILYYTFGYFPFCSIC